MAEHDCPYCGKPDCHEWHHARDEADYLHDVLDSTFDERDEARAEVERLREAIEEHRDAVLNQWHEPTYGSVDNERLWRALSPDDSRN